MLDNMSVRRFSCGAASAASAAALTGGDCGCLEDGGGDSRSDCGALFGGHPITLPSLSL